MNKVYLSGIVADAPIQIGAPENPTHAIFRLAVSHKDSKGEWRRELYKINSWNTAAQWVLDNLKQGQRVALVGYLTQRTVKSGESTSIAVEVTSQEFMPLADKRRDSASPPCNVTVDPPQAVDTEAAPIEVKEAS